MTTVDNFVKQSSVGSSNRPQGAVSRKSQRDHGDGDTPLRIAEDGPHEFLVANGGVARTNAEVGGRQEHAHCELSEVELDELPRGRWGENDDRRGSMCDVFGPGPGFRELLKLAAVRADNEVPTLLVVRRRRSPARFEDAVEIAGAIGSSVKGRTLRREQSAVQVSMDDQPIA
jgi:hypothetical protein